MPVNAACENKSLFRKVLQRCLTSPFMFASRHPPRMWVSPLCHRRRRGLPFLARITRASHRNHFIAGISSKRWSTVFWETCCAMVVGRVVVDSSSTGLAGWCWRAIFLGVHGSMIVDWIVVVGVAGVEALLLREGGV
jgi:hypothetical protein